MNKNIYEAGLKTSNYADNPYEFGTSEFDDFERGVTQHRRLSFPEYPLLSVRKRSYRDKSFLK